MSITTMRLFIEDKYAVLSGAHYGNWLLAYTGDTDEDVADFNAARREHADRRALLCYTERKRISINGDGNFPKRDIEETLAPGEYLHDANDQSTWSKWAQEWHRQRSFVNDLCDLPTSPKLTDAEQAEVLELVKKWALTRSDFRELDERPGTFGYEVKRGEETKTWHWKLRQVRNDSRNGRVLYASFAAEAP